MLNMLAPKNTTILHSVKCLIQHDIDIVFVEKRCNIVHGGSND